MAAMPAREHGGPGESHLVEVIVHRSVGAEPSRSAHAPTAASETGDPYARKWLIMAAVGTGTYLNVLDASMLNVSLPVITTSLGTEVATIQWVVTAYLLVISSLLLTGGRLADLYGRKRVYLGGMLVFATASVFCGLASTVTHLIVFRVLQGVGSAFVQGVSPAITASAFPPTERGKALGIQTTTVALAGITGPLIGGLITDALGWRWIFFLRIPLSLLVLALTFFVLRHDQPLQRQARFDLGGAASLVATLSSLLLALSQGRFWGWGSPPILALFATAIVFAIVFVRIELSVSNPMVPFHIFRNRLFTAASLSSMLNFMGTSASFFLMPFYLQQVLGYPPSQAGVLLIASAMMMSICAPISGALSDRFGSQVLSPLGQAFVVFALYQLSTLNAQSTPLDVMSRLALLGIGMGTFNSPNNNALISSAPRNLVGLASGVMASMRNLGNVVGVASAGTVLTAQTAYYAISLAGAGTTGEVLQVQAFLGGFRDAFTVAASFAALGLVASLLRGPRKQPAL